MTFSIYFNKRKTFPSYNLADIMLYDVTHSRPIRAILTQCRLHIKLNGGSAAGVPSRAAGRSKDVLMKCKTSVFAIQ